MVIPQLLHRTSLPRAWPGTAKTLWQARFGHMIRIVFLSDNCSLHPNPYDDDIGRAR